MAHDRPYCLPHGTWKETDGAREHEPVADLNLKVAGDRATGPDLPRQLL
jgi:hypothetical protein